MGGRITGLRRQTRKRDRVDVYLDGKCAFGLASVVAAELAIGQDLTAAEVDRLRQLDAVEDACQRAMRLLSRRPRSERELRTYFARHGIQDPVQQGALARLQERGYLDDESFARFWIEGRQTFRPRSARALQAELRQKGIPSEAIHLALAGLDEDAAAYQAARLAARKLRRDSEEDFRRKLGGHLARRGFNHETIRPVVERVWNEMSGPDVGSEA